MNLAKRLDKILSKKSRRIIGLMSGMSMDGVDLACADISGTFPHLQIRLIGTSYRPYSVEFQSRLKSGLDASVSEISKLNVLVAQEFSKCVEDYLKESGLDRSSVDAIGSHGQTLFHATGSECEFGSTLQVGAPSIIADLTGIPTIGNFRARDMSRGGTGAPLVSIADYLLFRDPNGPIAMNNLGSISNVTIVTPNLDDMLAFDTGPANMPIDFFAKMIPNNPKSIDTEGSLSATGKIIPELLEAFNQIVFFDVTPPRAAGFIEFGPDVLEKISKPFMDSKPEDLLRTAVEFSAVTIAKAYRLFVLPRYPSLKKAIFSGGGAYNLTLMNRLKELLPEILIEVLNSEWSDAKEALAFAILANETLSGRPGSIPAITGVHQPTVLGEIAL
jgi:anhydro-N-acetylmuramic acid kinase